MSTPLTVVTLEQLAGWGLLQQVQRESCIDQLIHEVRPPDANQLETLQKQWLQSHGIPNQRALHGWLNQQGLNEESWTKLITRPWLWQQWCQGQFKDQITSYYLKRKSQLDHVSYSLLRVRERTLATELYLRIKEGEATFEQVASEYSAGPERNSGGQLGPVPMQQPHPVLARLLQVSSPGQLWSPKQLENWWIVVRLNQLHATELDTKTAQQLALELGDQHLKQLLELSNPTRDNPQDSA
ncbi:peptidylprolyl isomerase [Synechococcus sp. LTW-R]|uniref:peptidylprolyl isomerase n=1 Tax=Synechococcus sp. LTW-R TaxID=2751170 RepID=UPI001624B7F1|nr:peptidylprolyl isomerase [Synechococcus sp. LTW-R]QNG28538.1 peptidylprolyl isomerase [Synechococcus sp. LTW-R]